MKEWTVDKICGWCKKKMGTTKSTLGPHPSHGLCKACMKKHFPEEYRKLKTEGRLPAENPTSSPVFRMQLRAMKGTSKFLKDYENASWSGTMKRTDQEDVLEDFSIMMEWFGQATLAMASGGYSMAFDLFFKVAVLSKQLSQQVTGNYS